MTLREGARISTTTPSRSRAYRRTSLPAGHDCGWVLPRERRAGDAYGQAKHQGRHPRLRADARL